jgi:hypothetical protein
MSDDKDRIPPVPVSPNIPGSGGRVRISVPKSGNDATLRGLDDAEVDARVGAVVGRVAGLLLAGHEYPMSRDLQLEAWVRESRRGFLKIEIDPMTIICGAAVAGRDRDRILGTIARARALSEFEEHPSFAFVPIVKAGLHDETIYYIEAPGLPDVISPELMIDSARFCGSLIAMPDNPLGITDARRYLEGLSRGEDPAQVVSFEPHLRRLLEATPESQRRSFVSQIGAQLQGSAESAAPMPNREAGQSSIGRLRALAARFTRRRRS